MPLSSTTEANGLGSPSASLATSVSAGRMLSSTENEIGGVAPAAPSDRTRSTLVFISTDVPGAGSCEITLPAGTVSLFAVVMEPTERLADRMADSAAGCEAAITFGTNDRGVDSSVTSIRAVAWFPALSLALTSIAFGPSFNCRLQVKAAPERDAA